MTLPRRAYVQVETPALRLPKRSQLLIFVRGENEPLRFNSENLVAERELPKQLRSMIAAARKQWESAGT